MTKDKLICHEASKTLGLNQEIPTNSRYQFGRITSKSSIMTNNKEILR